MRTARLVGLSPDGRTLILATEQGEELAVAADDRLRAAVRGDRPRLGQLEIQMETSFSPRDIQTRIRAGASLEDVASVAGLPMDRVERFAAPVLAEREHVAATAMSSSVRRRGETSGHRNLRATVAERLADSAVDPDTVDWDSSRREDGRWTVVAAYTAGETSHRAEFLYDLQGRFSVAGNDEARALLGELSPTRAAAPDRPDPAAEPTVGLDDELALVRATREPPSAVADLMPDDELPPEIEDEEAPAARTDEAAEPTVAVVRRLSAVQVTEVAVTETDDEGVSALDTLYAMLGDDGYAEDSTRGYAGLSDASAVPVVDEHDFEPAPAAADFPVEPGEDDLPAEPGGSEHPEAPEAPELEQVSADEGAATGAEVLTEETPTPEEPVDDEPDALIPGPAAVKKPVKRKRASVPSWDEIMFGGPKPR